MTTNGQSPTVAILLATQRSGTHLLKAALDTHPRIAAPFGEVFDADDEYSKLNFFRYMLERAQTDPKCVLPHQRLNLFEEYLKVVPAICGKPHVVLDIKYNSIHHVHTVWQTNVQSPPLFEFIHENKIPVIHLLRKNLLKTVISNMRAKELQQYHRINEPPITAKIHVDPQLVLACLDILNTLHAEIAQAIMRCPRILTLYYEELLCESPGDAGNETLLNPEPLRQIAALFNVEPNFRSQPLTKKVTPNDLRDVIVNYDELQSALAGSKYAQYLDGHSEGRKGKIRS
jgi:hypothetical protein